VESPHFLQQQAVVMTSLQQADYERGAGRGRVLVVVVLENTGDGGKVLENLD